MGQGASRWIYPYKLEAAAAWDDFRRKHLGKKGGLGATAAGPAGRPLVPTTGDIDEDLYNAAMADDISTVDRLIKAGGDPLATLDFDLTSFHVCMSAAVVARLTKGLPKRAREHLSSVRDSRGNTPVHTCARSNRQDAALGLIECGFDLQLKNDAGRTPAQVARSFHFYNTARILDRLANCACWCGVDFDLEDSMQLYMKIYAFREPVIEVYSYLSDQKLVDMEEEAEIRKKLNPLLESREERKQWEANKEKEKKKKAEAGEEDVLDLVAKPLRTWTRI